MRRRILYIQYTNPSNYPPLEHSSRILAADGWQVLFLGVEAAGKTNQLTSPPHPNIEIRLWRHSRPGWRQKVHYFAFVCWCIWNCFRTRPDWVYASESLSYPAGWLLARSGVRVIMHEHDSPAPPRNRFLRALAWCRRHLARRARLCVIPQEERARTLERELRPRRVEVVWNCPAKEEVAPPREQPPAGLTAWYHGSIVPDQFPLVAVRALAALPPSIRLHFAGYETIGHRGYIAEILAEADRVGVRDRVVYFGTPPTRQELYLLAGRCDVGLALFTRVFREPMAGASNKPFDYLACGLALLLPDTPEWEQLYIASGYGRACDPADPHSIASALRSFLEDRLTTRDMGEAGRQKILTHWNYESQFETVHRFLTADGNYSWENSSPC